MEAHAVVGRYVVPLELGVSDQLSGGRQFLVGGLCLNGGGGVEVCTGDSAFGPEAAGGDLVLDGLDACLDLGLAPAVAHGAAIGDIQQGALDVVVCDLHSALAAIGHVAVGTGDVAVVVHAGGEHLVVGVLTLDDAGLGDRVDEVDEVDERGVVGIVGAGVDEVGGVIILDHLLDRRALGERVALLPRERKILALALEVVLDVALGADERAHFLVRGGLDAPPGDGLVALPQGRTRYPQGHRLGVVTVEAPDGMLDVLLQVVPVRRVEVCGPQSDQLDRVGLLGVLFPAELGHLARHVGRLARPARARVEDLLALLLGLLDSLGLADVLHRPDVPAGLEIVLREAVPGEDDHLVGIAVEVVAREGPAVPGLHRRRLLALVGVVFPLVVLAPHGVVGLELVDIGGDQGRSLGLPAAVHDRRGQQEQQHDHDGGQYDYGQPGPLGQGGVGVISTSCCRFVSHRNFSFSLSRAGVTVRRGAVSAEVPSAKPTARGLHHASCGGSPSSGVPGNRPGESSRMCRRGSADSWPAQRALRRR